MSNKFDSKTAKKIINEYADKLNFYMKENTSLKSQLDDIKITLNINKDLMFKSVNGENVETLLNQLKQENIRLSDLINNLNNEKAEMDSKILKIQLNLESRNTQEAIELLKVKDEIFLLNNKLKEKESTIIFLRKENEKYIANDNTTDKKVYIVEPNKSNVDINNELNTTRDILAKISKQVNAEKNKNEKLTKQLDILSKEIDLLKSGTKCGKCLEKEQGEVEYNSHEDEEIDDEEEEDAVSLESEVIKFPDKVKIPVNDKQTSGVIPKLDFTKVQEKYQTEVKKTVNKEIKKPLNKNEEILEKLKNDLKQSQKTIDELNTKIERYKNIYKTSRLKITYKNETIRKLNQRIDSLETQLRKSGLISTDDITNKRNDESLIVYIY